MIKKYNYWVVGFILLVLNACEEKKTTYPLVSAVPFFDFVENTTLNYSGDSIIYNDFTNKIDTVTFFYKDSLVEVDTVGEQIAYQFERYIAYTPTSTFQYLKNYTLTKGKIGIIRVEDLRNNFLLPAAFEIGTQWNGNQYQLGDEQLYTISNKVDSFIKGENRAVVEVVQQNESNLIEEDYINEKYAVGLGMVSAYYKHVSKDISSGIIKSGSIVTLVYKP